MLTAAYKAFEERVANTTGARGAKERWRAAVDRMTGRFTIAMNSGARAPG
jgi:hypothetical protein